MLDLVQELLEVDYQINLEARDYGNSREEFAEKREKALQFWLSTAPAFSYTQQVHPLDNDRRREMVAKSRELIKKRELFLFQEFENPKYGSGLEKRITDNSKLYKAVVGNYMKTEERINLSDAIYWAMTDEGLKFVYHTIFDVDTGTFEKLIDRPDKEVVEEGELISTQKFEAPNTEKSLAYYNAQ